MKLRALLLVFLVVTSVGCIKAKIDETKPPVEFRAVISQDSLNQSIKAVYYLLLQVHSTYLLTWNNTSVEISEKVPLVFVKMKNHSWLIGANELSDNVFLLKPGSIGSRVYSCHCADGKIIDFKVSSNPYSFHRRRDFYVNYKVKRVGPNEYTFTTIGYSVEHVRIFGEVYTMKLGEVRGTWSSNDVKIEPLGNYTYRVRVQGKDENGIRVTLSIIPIILTGGKENVTLTTIPIDIEV